MIAYYKYFIDERIYIEVNFNYEESCRIVYKSFSVYRNGKKSNIRGLNKYLNATSPSILSQNCYFWNPSRNASGRRYNEQKRENEVSEYFKAEGFSAINTFPLESPFKLKRGENYGIDNEGNFLSYRGEKYHFGFIRVKESNLDEARKAIRKRREIKVEQSRQDEEFKRLKHIVFVTIEDSIFAGNCPVGTKRFYRSLPLVKKGFSIRAIRGSALLNLRNDSYTRRAVYQAIKRMKENKNQSQKASLLNKKVA